MYLIKSLKILLGNSSNLRKKQPKKGAVPKRIIRYYKDSK